MFRSSNRFGRGTGAILFDDMNCDGTESSLRATSCLWRNSNPDFCSHSSDVGVRCDSIGGSGECYCSAITVGGSSKNCSLMIFIFQSIKVGVAFCLCALIIYAS